MHTTLTAITAAVLSLLAATGCYRVSNDVIVSHDGSGTLTIEALLDKREFDESTGLLQTAETESASIEPTARGLCDTMRNEAETADTQRGDLSDPVLNYSVDYQESESHCGISTTVEWRPDALTSMTDVLSQSGIHLESTGTGWAYEINTVRSLGGEDGFGQASDMTDMTVMVSVRLPGTSVNASEGTVPQYDAEGDHTTFTWSHTADILPPVLHASTRIGSPQETGPETEAHDPYGDVRRPNSGDDASTDGGGNWLAYASTVLLGAGLGAMLTWAAMTTRRIRPSGSQGRTS